MSDVGRRPAHGEPHLVKLTAEGFKQIQAVRRVRDDRVVRRRVCRNRLLAWAAEQHADPWPWVEQFHSDDRSSFYGSAFTTEEVIAAATYLAGEGLVEFTKTMGNAGTIKITHAGAKCVERFASDVAAWEEHRDQMNGGRTVQTIHNSGTFHAPVTAVTASGDVGTVSQTVSIGVDAKAITDWMAALGALLPVAQLPDDQLARVQAAVTELQEHLNASQLEPGVIRRAGQAVLDALPDALAAAAMDNAPAIFASLLEVGKQLFGV